MANADQHEIRTVALLGSGAVGAFFIAGFTKPLGDRFCVVAEGERADRLRANGVIVNDTPFFPAVKSPAEAAGVDLLLIATKDTTLREALPSIQTIVKENTTVISALNGLESEEVIADAVGKAHLLYALMRIIAHRDGNKVRYPVAQTAGLFFGEADGTISARVQAVDRLLSDCGLPHVVTEKILEEQWKKFALNIANNIPQAIVSVGYGAYLDSDHMKFIHDKLYDETVAVADIYGIRFERETNDTARSPLAARFSTLQDLDAHRPTEIDTLCGGLMRKAAAVSVPVPYTEYSYHLIRLLEEKNAGKFVYET